MGLVLDDVSRQTYTCIPVKFSYRRSPTYEKRNSRRCESGLRSYRAYIPVYFSRFGFVPIIMSFEIWFEWLNSRNVSGTLA